MITIDKEPGMRRGRVFVRDGDVQNTEHLRQMDPPIEPEDEERFALLHDSLIQHKVSRGTAHPGVDLSDVMDVYVTLPSTNECVFACVIVSRDRLKHMLMEAPVVVEDFCFQVAESRLLTPSAIAAALEAWATRNFADVLLPQFNVEFWSDATNDPSSVLFELLLSSTPEGELPTEHNPSITVERPWEEAA